VAPHWPFPRHPSFAIGHGVRVPGSPCPWALGRWCGSGRCRPRRRWHPQSPMRAVARSSGSGRWVGAVVPSSSSLLSTLPVVVVPVSVSLFRRGLLSSPSPLLVSGPGTRDPASSGSQGWGAGLWGPGACFCCHCNMCITIT
jgi:hypothetical protein